jgi:hypothetical protein
MPRWPAHTKKTHMVKHFQLPIPLKLQVASCKLQAKPGLILSAPLIYYSLLLSGQTREQYGRTKGKGVDRRHSTDIADFFSFSQLEACTHTVDFNICLEMLSYACQKIRHISSLTDYFWSLSHIDFFLCN